MTRGFGLVLLVFLLLAQTLSAQTALIRIQWDPNPPGENVLSYNLYVDALPVISVPTTITPACACIETRQPFLSGPHTVKVGAVNLGLSTDPTDLQEGPLMMGTFTLNARVDIKNIRIVK